MNVFRVGFFVFLLSANIYSGVCSDDETSMKRQMSWDGATDSPGEKRSKPVEEEGEYDMECVLYIHPDHCVLSPTERNFLFKAADKGIFSPPLTMVDKVSGQKIELYSKGMDRLIEERCEIKAKLAANPADEKILQIQDYYLQECEPIVKKMMWHRQCLFINKYYDGLIDLSDISATEVDSDFIYWKTLNRAFTSDVVAFFALNLLRFKIIPRNKFKGFFPAIFEGIHRRAKLCEAGALFNQGFLYLYGLDGTSDEIKAFDIFKAAAAEGNNNAKYYVAMAYRKLGNTEENRMNAVKYLRDAASNNHVPSKLFLRKNSNAFGF